MAGTATTQAVARSRRSTRDAVRHERNVAIVTSTSCAGTAGERSATVRNRLVTENLGLVHHAVGRLGVHVDDYDDAVSAGTLGLLRACRDWDPRRGASLATYAAPWIRQYVVRHLRSSHRSRRDLIAHDHVFHDRTRSSAMGGDGNATRRTRSLWGDVDVDPSDIVDERVTHTASLVAAVSNLDDMARATVSTFVACNGDERRAATVAGVAVGTWRHRFDRAWSMLRHPSGSCLGGGVETHDDGYRRWRLIPPVGAFFERAACRGIGVERFFPDPGGSTAAAVVVCATCPVRADCLAYAVGTPSVVGVWGGTGPRERRALRVPEDPTTQR